MCSLSLQLSTTKHAAYIYSPITAICVRFRPGRTVLNPTVNPISFHFPDRLTLFLFASVPIPRVRPRTQKESGLGIKEQGAEQGAFKWKLLPQPHTN